MSFPKSNMALIGGGIALIALFAVSGSVFETNNAGTYQVKQAAGSGTMSCRNQPGMYWQGFGDIHDYKEADAFHFSADENHDGTVDNPITTGFNDNTRALVSGSLRVILPNDCPALIELHRKFGSMDGLMQKLVLPAVREALFFTGPHMSAAESLAARRAEFAALAEDQLQDGVIRVSKHEIEILDPITGQNKTVLTIDKEPCSETSDRCVGGFVRDVSAVKEYGVRVSNFVIDNIDYPKEVLTQIETQRQAQMNILTQQAQAREAEARALKADAEAKAQIAETRASEEVAKTQSVVRAEAKKAEAVLQAQQKREVAAQDVESALLEKKAKILRAEGDAEAAAKLIQADGALKQKLDAYVAVQKVWADAYTKQRPTPEIVFGGGNTSTGHNPAQAFMEITTAKAMRDMQLDLSVQRK